MYVHVIDTGIYTSHSDFGDRASNVYDAFGGNGQDCNGHSTHVAGTINQVNPAIANMSLSGGYSFSLNTAVSNLHHAGVIVAVAAATAVQSPATTRRRALVPCMRGGFDAQTRGRAVRT